MDLMKSIAQEYVKSDIPAFGVGDTVRVHIKIKEGNRERIQVFLNQFPGFFHMPRIPVYIFNHL